MAGTQALERGLAVLGVVAAASSSVSIAEIAVALDMPESTTYRVVQALKRCGLLTRVGRSGVRMGPAVFALARSAQRQVADDIPMIALPFMKELVEATGETAILTVPYGLDVVCVATVEGPQPLHVSFPKLSVTPLYAGSAVAALAHLDVRLATLVVASARGEELRRRTTRQRGAPAATDGGRQGAWVRRQQGRGRRACHQRGRASVRRRRPLRRGHERSGPHRARHGRCHGRARAGGHDDGRGHQPAPCGAREPWSRGYRRTHGR